MQIVEPQDKVAVLEKLRSELGEEIVNPQDRRDAGSDPDPFLPGIGPLGTWDRSGNVWEWTGAWYDEDKRYRVVRGGSWIGCQWFVRVLFCNWSIPLKFTDDLGFRVVIAPEEAA